MKNLRFLFFTLMAIAMLSSCNEDESPSGETVDNDGTIADFISGNSDYTSLQLALERTGLEIFLDGTDPYTFIAPSNASFQAFLSNNDFDAIENVPLDTLTSILTNHVIVGDVSSTELPEYKNSLQEFLGYRLSVHTTENAVLNGHSTIVNGDVSVSNGTVHTVDSILPLPSMLSHIQSNDRFSIFEEALVAASAGNGSFLTRLEIQYAEGYTVFLPNNEAFQVLLDALEINDISNIDVVSLRKLINYHFYPSGNLRSGDISEGMILTSQQGEELSFSLANGIQVVDAIGETSAILTANIQGVNGVIHEVDKVLYSQEAFEFIVPTIMQEIRVNSSLSMLEEALDITGLNELLEDRNTDLTIMAPANFAFTAFLDGEDIDDMPVDLLTSLLKNHVLSGLVYEANFNAGYMETSATFSETGNPLSLFVNTENGLQLNGNVSLLETDIERSNGIIHLTNRVLAIPTVLTFIAADPDLDLLQSGLTTRNDVPDYATILSDPLGSGIAPFTIFSPTDEAFIDVFDELSIFGLGGLDGPTLTGVLNNHIVSGAALRSEDLVSGPLNTLGDQITVNAVNATLTDQNGRTANIIEVNIQAGNGVVHKIDKVLLAN